MDPVALFERIEQVTLESPVHEPSPPSLERFNVYPSTSCALLIEVVSVVSVGTMWRPSSSTNTFLSSVVVQSKEPVPNPLI